MPRELLAGSSSLCGTRLISRLIISRAPPGVETVVPTVRGTGYRGQGSRLAGRGHTSGQPCLEAFRAERFLFSWGNRIYPQSKLYSSSFAPANLFNPETCLNDNGCQPHCQRKFASRPACFVSYSNDKQRNMFHATIMTTTKTFQLIDFPYCNFLATS
eukprot:SAG31_NODE_3156_length_4610_cov_12.728663_4_plen_158_part_00